MTLREVLLPEYRALMNNKFFFHDSFIPLLRNCLRAISLYIVKV